MSTTPADDAAAQDAADRAAFRVGGHERKLSPEQQLEQLSSYIQAHYPAPAKNPPWSDDPTDPALPDTFDARLPDRITHAAMLMLGSAVDHSTPGVAYGTGVSTQDIDPKLLGGAAGLLITPSAPNGAYAVSLHPGGWWKGSGVALEHSWRPEVAAVAELSGVTFVDLDYPLVPEHNLEQVRAAVQHTVAWIRQEHPEAPVYGWGYSSGGALAVLCADLFDALALTFPHLDLSMLPEEVRGAVDFTCPAALPPTLLQYADHDAIAAHYPWFEAWYTDTELQVREYVSEHRIATPEVMRTRVADVAAFLRQQNGSSAA